MVNWAANCAFRDMVVVRRARRCLVCGAQRRRTRHIYLPDMVRVEGMRTVDGPLDEEEQAEARYCEDVGHGYRVQCSACKHETVVYTVAEKVFCSNVECWRELIYRPWWSW